MRRNVISGLLQAVVVGSYIFGLVICLFLLPRAVWSLMFFYPALIPYQRVALGFGWAMALPIFIALAIAWRIFIRIGRDESFAQANVKGLLWIYRLALLDFFILGLTMVLAFSVGVFSDFILLCAVLGLFLCLAAAIICFVLAKLIDQGAQLQMESEYTI